MKTDDQWFHPGDKVMRVALASDLGVRMAPHAWLVPETDYGRVLCVERCWTRKRGDNRVTFVGIRPDQWEQGFTAACFRKVEEIKLCVRAAAKLREPVEANNKAE